MSEESAAGERRDQSVSAEINVTPALESPVSHELPQVRRQSLSLRGGACDMRVGAGALERVGNDLKPIVGNPNRAVLVHGAEVRADDVEVARRCLVDAGFSVSLLAAPAGRAVAALPFVNEVYGTLARAGVTADDAVVAIGDAGLISALVFACSTWCGGVALCAVPTSLDGMVEVPVTPRPLDLGSEGDVEGRGVDMVLCRSSFPRLLVCDTLRWGGASDGAPSGAVVTTGGPDVGAPLDEGALMGRAVLVATAVAAGERSFSDLALRADGLLSGDGEALADELLDITKGRARLFTSSAVAIRQGLSYGTELARGLASLLPGVAPSLLLGEGLRFASRLAVAHQGKGAELVFAQDALLDKLGLPEVPCELDPDAVLDSVKRAAFQRSNRFMVAMPLDYGRVRLTAAPDDMLREHLGAWCKARRKLARRICKSS